jgi:hypothetical protein
MVKCWNCDKVKDFKWDCKEEKRRKRRMIDDEFKKYSQEDSGEAFDVALETHVGWSAWLIKSKASFHMTVFFSV